MIYISLKHAPHIEAMLYVKILLGAADTLSTASPRV